MEIKKYLEIDFNKNDLANYNQVSKKDNIEFSKVLDEIQDKIDYSDKLITDYVNGKDVPIHNIIISLEQAKLSVTLLSEIRNKIIESYNELTRTVG
ncbi:MAG: flagellar hook-basal body complex protein FliE [Elusimicrobiales bacterium]|nr:flagellar hook-basal body complex protein FliE [Elusimicrobiales bacterium]